jgi:hypothetical protein
VKRTGIIVGVLAALLLVARVYLWEPSTAPRGQGALVALSDSNLNEFKAAFDGDTNVPRLVLLLSPT